MLRPAVHAPGMVLLAFVVWLLAVAVTAWGPGRTAEPAPAVSWWAVALASPGCAALLWLAWAQPHAVTEDMITGTPLVGADPFTWFLSDAGHPSWVHNALILAVRTVGGLSLVRTLQAGLYVVLVLAVHGAARRVAGLPLAWLVTCSVVFDTAAPFRMWEVRSRATSLAAVALALLGMAAWSERPTRRAAALVVAAGGLAALDNPLLGVLAGAFGLSAWALAEDADVRGVARRATTGLVLLGLALLPTIQHGAAAQLSQRPPAGLSAVVAVQALAWLGLGAWAGRDPRAPRVLIASAGTFGIVAWSLVAVGLAWSNQVLDYTTLGLRLGLAAAMVTLPGRTAWLAMGAFAAEALVTSPLSGMVSLGLLAAWRAGWLDDDRQGRVGRTLGVVGSVVVAGVVVQGVHREQDEAVALHAMLRDGTEAVYFGDGASWSAFVGATVPLVDDSGWLLVPTPARTAPYLRGAPPCEGPLVRVGYASFRARPPFAPPTWSDEGFACRRCEPLPEAPGLGPWRVWHPERCGP